MRHKKHTIVLWLLVAFVISACVAPIRRAAPTAPQVLFVCEHGNVKSLMAASHFNKLSQERHLPYRAISRGSAPDSTTVPPAIVEGLRRDGFNVSEFRPLAVTTSDVTASQHVVLIGADLPATVQAYGSEPERWVDVPAASTDYAAARDSLRSHVAELLDKLAQDKHR